jgi:hypothetical protein
MELPPRQTRSRSRATSPQKSDQPVSRNVNNPAGTLKVDTLQTLPEKLTAKLTQLSGDDLKILTKKQSWLRNYRPSIPVTPTPEIEAAINATLVFAQEEAGTAVCISPDGLLLTCSHCIAESKEELSERTSKGYWLLLASGQVVQAKHLAWDAKRDLALLKIVATQSRSTAEFAHVKISQTLPKVRARLICIGHPGSEDLEASMPGIQTNYDVLYVSEGKFCGYAAGQDIQDNSEIGALMHDCWTYWGHSGAPLVDVKSGEVVGMHSSWDDQTAMRRGIALQAIQEFLSENMPSLLE